MARPTRRELIEQLLLEVRASQVATDAVDQAAAKRLGVNRTDARCLDVLERDGPMPAGRLAKEARLSTPAMTAALDRLERARYVRRRRDPQDRRRVLVELTEKARRAGRAIYGAPDSVDFDAFFARYNRDELEVLLDFHRRGRELNEARLARLRRSK